MDLRKAIESRGGEDTVEEEIMDRGMVLVTDGRGQNLKANGGKAEPWEGCLC